MFIMQRSLYLCVFVVPLLSWQDCEARHLALVVPVRPPVWVFKNLRLECLKGVQQSQRRKKWRLWKEAEENSCGVWVSARKRKSLRSDWRFSIWQWLLSAYARKQVHNLEEVKSGYDITAQLNTVEDPDNRLKNQQLYQGAGLRWDSHSAYRFMKVWGVPTREIARICVSRRKLQQAIGQASKKNPKIWVEGKI